MQLTALAEYVQPALGIKKAGWPKATGEIVGGRRPRCRAARWRIGLPFSDQGSAGS